MLTRKIFESRVSEMPFPGLRKRHFNISEALAAWPMFFSVQPQPGGHHLAHWGWGPPGSPGPSP